MDSSATRGRLKNRIKAMVGVGNREIGAQIGAGSLYYAAGLDKATITNAV